MTLGRIRPAQRPRLRLHGWLLALWAMAVGSLANLALLRLGLHDLALRYALGAAAFYFGGFLVGGWWYVRWWRSQPRLAADFPRPADEADRLAYAQDQQRRRSRLDWLGDLGGIPDLDDVLGAILFAVGVLLVALMATLLVWTVPVLLTEALAGFLAELLLEFVIGAAVLRKAARPRALDDYWDVTLRGTGLAGLAAVAAAGAFGLLLQWLAPGAHTLVQALRLLAQ